MSDPKAAHAGQLDPSELTVNDLERLQKHSDRLVLETYNHCEVPAGCGGVVLRWVEPSQPLQLGIRLHLPSATTNTTTLDGRTVPASQLELATGTRHVLVIELVFNEWSAQRTLMAAISTRLSAVRREGRTVTDTTFASSAAPAWSFRDSLPEEADLIDLSETSPAWHPVVEVSHREPEEGSVGRWSWQRCSELGAQFIALPSEARRLWLRVLLDL